MIRKFLSTSALVAALALGGAVKEATAATGGDTLWFGIVPQQSASRLARTWGPFLAELSTRTGMNIRFRTTKDIPTFEACLASGAFDIAYMNPMHYAIFAEEGGYRAIAHQSKKRLRGILVKRKDAGISALGDLDSSRIAFPSPGAFGASVLTRSALAGAGVDFEPAYVNSHDSVYRAVASGLVQAGGGVLRTFNAVDPAVRDQLEIFYETEAYTPHAFATMPSLTEAERSSLATAMLSIAAERGDLVSSIGMSGIDPADDSDWDDVRNLNMPRASTGIAGKDGTCPSG